jgi:hypothetical protein
MGEFIERRKLPRMSVRWPDTVYTQAGEVMAETKDITSTGAYVLCGERLNLNEAYPLRIKVPPRNLMVKGKVIWSNLFTDKAGMNVFHTGIFFIQIESEDRQVLREAILESGA